jgi:hypothetical protein
MGWDDLIKSLGDEVSTITHAPLAFLLVVLVAAGPIFALARWRFSVRLEHLETRLKLREDEIAALKNPAESILAGVGQSRRSDEFRLKGRPDTSLALALQHLSGSVWATHHKAGAAAVNRELADKLTLGIITAFGRIEPEGAIEPMNPLVWRSLRFDAKRGNAIGPDDRSMYYDLQFDSEYLEVTWPTPRGWMAL